MFNSNSMINHWLLNLNTINDVSTSISKENLEILKNVGVE